MAKFCLMCGQVTNCTENCKSCFDEEQRERLEERVKALEYITSDIDTIIDTRGDTNVKEKISL